MNEQIKQLAEQARLISVDDTTRYASDDEFEQKFARLIVRECMKWCDAHATINGTAQQIRDSIKKDFGVEE